mgnify:CR=1 FL=1
MSMEISGNYKDYKNEYLERAQTEQDKVKRTSQEQRAEDKSEGVPIPKDEYISSEKSGSKPTPMCTCSASRIMLKLSNLGPWNAFAGSICAWANHSCQADGRVNCCSSVARARSEGA